LKKKAFLAFGLYVSEYHFLHRIYGDLLTLNGRSPPLTALSRRKFPGAPLFDRFIEPSDWIYASSAIGYIFDTPEIFRPKYLCVPFFSGLPHVDPSGFAVALAAAPLSPIFDSFVLTRPISMRVLDCH